MPRVQKRVYCSVYGCLNSASSKPELSFFKLPADVERRSKWLCLISREDLIDKPPQHYTVCEEHFDSVDVLPGKQRKKLKTSSLPSLHLPDIERKGAQTTTEAPTLVDICTQTEDNVTNQTSSCLSDTPRNRKLKLDLLEQKEKRSTVNPESHTNRKRNAIDNEYSENYQRDDIDDIEIDYNNIDKFGEQIAFLLKRIPRQLCRELQESIVTLVKTATKNHEIETMVNVTESTSASSSTKKIKANIQPGLSLAFDRNLNDTELTLAADKHIDETTQATQHINRLETPSDHIFTSTIKTFPQQITAPLELIRSLDCVKQEVQDPEMDSEQYNEVNSAKITVVDPLITDIKIEIEETDLIELAKRRNSD